MSPEDRITSIGIREIRRPLKVRFATSLGGKDTMGSLIVTVTLGDGSSGSGECPTSAAFPGETIPVMRTLLAGWRERLKGLPIQEGFHLTPEIRRTYPAFPMVVSGLETALFRALLCHRGEREDEWWGGRSREIETDITIPFLPGHPGLLPWVDYTVKKGFGTFKVKVSGHADEDKRFLSLLFDYLGRKKPGFKVRLDGNQGYGVNTFLRMTDWLEKKGQRIELFEQPLPREDHRGLKAVAGRSPVPVILDETVVTAADLVRAIDQGMGHGVNIKLSKSGIHETRGIMAVAAQAGFGLMIGCMTESMVGLSAGICLAAGSSAFDYVDLDGIYFLHHRNRYGSIEIKPPRYLITGSP